MIREEWQSDYCLLSFGYLSCTKHCKGARLAAVGSFVLVGVCLVVVFLESAIEASKNPPCLVERWMIFSRCEFEVIGRVVQFVAVLVVDEFRRKQFSPNNTFHDNPMLKSPSILPVYFGSQQGVSVAYRAASLERLAGITDGRDGIVMETSTTKSAIPAKRPFAYIGDRSAIALAPPPVFVSAFFKVGINNKPAKSLTRKVWD